MKIPSFETYPCEMLASIDCVLLVTDHSDFPYELIAAHAPLIVDTRDVYGKGEANVIKA